MPFSINTHRKERIKGKRTGQRGRRTLPAVRGKGLSDLFFLLSHLLKDSLCHVTRLTLHSIKHTHTQIHLHSGSWLIIMVDYLM